MYNFCVAHLNSLNQLTKIAHKHLSTDADSSTDTKQILLVRQNLQKKRRKKLRGDFTLFMRQRFTIGDHFFPILFHKDSKYLKSLDIGLHEVGTKNV